MISQTALIAIKDFEYNTIDQIIDDDPWDIPKYRSTFGIITEKCRKVPCLQSTNGHALVNEAGCHPDQSLTLK